MTTQILDPGRANLFGSLWMIGSMAGFAVEDMFLKAAAQTLPLGQILMLFGAGGALVFAALAIWKGQPLYTPEVLSRPMRWRVFFEIFGRLFYALAIALIPLSVATVILQATPLVVVAGAAVIFGERVGWRRWTAVFVGLVGVVVIIQPSGGSFSALSILAVGGMLGFAGRDLASRAAPASLSTYILGFYGFLSVVVAGAVILLWSGASVAAMDITLLLTILGAVLAGVTAYGSLMKAMRTGDVSAVTPFRYTRLIFGIALGILVFNEALTGAMILGSVLIMLSGLFIFWRGKQIQQP
ncbi:DMT family transporter [Pseudooceanicola sp. MF1-13]|uniref:DMT family transporter n=1 Tax=Pseudooceanicola sp. MF1-13 TaxID=3379095 RepID=UPI0038918C80